MVIVLPAEHIRQSVERILEDSLLDAEEKFEALSALHTLNAHEVEEAIKASGSGSLTIGCHASLFAPNELYS